MNLTSKVRVGGTPTLLVWRSARAPTWQTLPLGAPCCLDLNGLRSECLESRGTQLGESIAKG